MSKDDPVDSITTKGLDIHSGDKKPPEPKKVETRGRKKKPKPVAWATVKSSDQGKAMDQLITTVINRTILKDAEQLEEKDVSLGSAALYTLSYYAPEIPVDHPVTVLLGASLGLMFKVGTKRGNKKLPGAQIPTGRPPTPPAPGDVKPGDMQPGIDKTKPGNN